jgi:hypothetical protein
MSAEPSAIPPNPKTAATKAMIRKTTISRIIKVVYWLDATKLLHLYPTDKRLLLI